jgi:hypothetical protein
MRGPFEFVTEWSVEGTLAEVNSILQNVESFPLWWRPVYISAIVTRPGEPDGTGRRVQFATRGFLPYVLRWQLRVTQSREPLGFTFRASGDLVGVGIWQLRPDESRVKLRLDWKVRPQKAVVRALSLVSRRLISKNHAWAMRKGQEGLQAEILHQRLRSGQSFSGQLQRNKQAQT